MKRIVFITLVFFFVGTGFSQAEIQNTTRELEKTSAEYKVISNEGCDYLVQRVDKLIELQINHNALLQKQIKQEKKNAWSGAELLFVILLAAFLIKRFW